MKTEKEQLTKLKTVGCWQYIKVTDCLKDKVKLGARTTGDWRLKFWDFISSLTRLFACTGKNL